MTALEMFTRLPHLNKGFEVVDDLEYPPNLYHFRNRWHVDWISCNEGDILHGFNAETPEKAIQKAYDFCVKKKLIKNEQACQHTMLTALQNAADCITVSKLSDDDLRWYCAICEDGKLDAEREMYRREYEKDS